MKKVALKGLTTGLILQVAIGPVFLFLMNITLQKTLMDGFSAVLAVTIVDYLYIILAIVGIGKLLEKEKVKRLLGIFSSIVLILFGIYILINSFDRINGNRIISVQSSNLYQSFITTFVLTISSPLTIVFWSSIFAARSLEYSLSKKELIVFGFSAGFATPLFLSLSIVIVSLLKTSIPALVFQLANIIIGVLLIGYGMKRLIASRVAKRTETK